ncbi:MAG: 3-phosphoshikimate 1-carboxyvinyltransferase, partial [Clostridium perfringens]
MKKVIITPSKLKGSVKIPPSKSMAHRAIICASLSKGESVISNIDFSEDIIATMEGMKSLGANIKVEKDKLIINGENILKDSNYKVIDCNESGSTLRFLVPISLIKDNRVNFIGRGNLGKRPLKTYYEIFEEQEIKYSYEEEKLDLNIEGSLKGGEFKVKGNISSQFISGLLFTLPLLKEDSKITITTELESKGYIDLTLDMIEKFGVTIKNNNYREFLIKGNQSYKPMNYKVEGDYSQAAFYFSAGALGSEINCLDLDLSSYQGDKECIEILEGMGARLIESQERSLSIIHGDLNGTIIDASQCPDIIPVLTVVAALSKGETRIINGERLRIKECDRLNAICTE